MYVLGKYQQELGSHCANCKGNVQPASLGKYCVRFGYEVKQFCCSTCLEEFKKGLKVCSFCQKDISSGAEGFLAPVGDKGTFKVSIYSCVACSVRFLLNHLQLLNICPIMFIECQCLHWVYFVCRALCLYFFLNIMM